MSLDSRLLALSIESPHDLLDRLVVRVATVPSLVGDLFVAWTLKGISRVSTIPMVGDFDEFVDEVHSTCECPVLPGDAPQSWAKAARRGDARRLPFDLEKLTPFEREVLGATQTIPCGEVRPYAWVAAAIGRPRAVRAVGSALGRNPVPVLIPCHRVTRSDGSVGHYGGGTEMKVDLLRAESVNLDEIAELAGHDIHYVGCTTTGVVCFPSCRALRRSAPHHRRGFSTLEAAQSAGFRACRRCRPAGSAA